MLGKEAALFVPSGDDGQRDRRAAPDRARRRGAGRAPQPRRALRARGHERDLGRDAAHAWTARAATSRPSRCARRWRRTPTTSPTLKLVVLENTHNLGGGTVQSLAEQRAVIAAARECGFKVHLDGARIWNAAVALGVAPAELAAGVDTVMTCLSKGLCAPAGSLVASTRERIVRGAADPQAARRRDAPGRRAGGGRARGARDAGAAPRGGPRERAPAGRGVRREAAASRSRPSRPTSWSACSRAAARPRPSRPSARRACSARQWTRGRCASRPTGTSRAPIASAPPRSSRDTGLAEATAVLTRCRRASE